MEADDSSNLRVASFSYYLDTAKESSLVQRVSPQDNITIKFSNTDSLQVDSFPSSLNASSSSSSDPVQDPTSAFSFSHQTPKLAAEIGVFGADKYFNMKLEYQTSAAAKMTQRATTKLAPPATPSSCSDSTSWNSQSTLLPNFQRGQPPTKQKRAAMASRIFMGIGCRGPCFDRKSIELAAQRAFYASNPPSRAGSQRVDHHAPPPPPAAAAKVKIEDLEESRRSLEVFGSRNRPSKGDVATNMERKLSMLTWDAIPKGRNHPPTSAAGTSTVCDDLASEASSDLFEIENISGSVYPLLESEAAAAADDAASSACMSPASVYAPSEASIQWSVVTASAADYSALSEFNDDSVSVAGRAPPRGRTKKEAPKISRPAGFLGCKNHKAVDVAQNVCVKSFNKD